MQDKHSVTLTELLPGFMDYMTAERHFSPVTTRRYRENVDWFVRSIGDVLVTDLSPSQFISLKARMTERDAGPSRIASVIYSMKCLLTYAHTILQLPVMDVSTLRGPRKPKRTVLYLSDAELNNFVDSIPLRTWTGKPRISGYRFRALLETLSATAM